MNQATRQLLQNWPFAIRILSTSNFVHRLDYATSGCLSLALTQAAADKASKAFRNRLVQKYYLALVRGHVKETKKEIDVAIGEDASGMDAHRMCTEHSQNCLKPRRAKTLLTLLETGLYDGQPASKVLLIPVTGRRHQLRVHMSHIGHMIVGDYTYSMGKDTKPFRMMLHAWKLHVPGLFTVRTDDPFVQDTLWRIEGIHSSLHEMEFDQNR